MFVVEKACLSKCMGEVGMKKEWLYKRVLSGCYISNWEFWDDPQPLRLTNYPWLDDWNWKQLMPGGWKRKLISFILPPHLFRAGGKRDQKKKRISIEWTSFFMCLQSCMWILALKTSQHIRTSSLYTQN